MGKTILEAKRRNAGARGGDYEVLTAHVRLLGQVLGSSWEGGRGGGVTGCKGLIFPYCPLPVREGGGTLAVPGAGVALIEGRPAQVVSWKMAERGGGGRRRGFAGQEADLPAGGGKDTAGAQ